jgi:hypothetical protein
MGLTANTGPYNAAAEHYGVDDNVMSKIPRKKFQFSVDITVNETVPLIDESYGRSFTFHRVQGVSLPDYNYGTVNVNQYNRQRYVHTRIEPGQAGITFYDTVDNQFQYLLQSYAQHYGHGHSMSQQTMAAYDTITPSFDGSFGLKPINNSERFFFPRIAILSRDTANSARSVTMYNCMITSVQHDRLDYSDSAPVLWTVQFQPEHVNLDTANSSNGTNAVGANAPTRAYDVAKSVAAGVLVTAAGEVIKDAIGNPIRTSSVENIAATATSAAQRFVTDSNGNAVRDSSGNPVIVGTVNANLPGGVNASASFTPQGVVNGFKNVINNWFG